MVWDILYGVCREPYAINLVSTYIIISMGQFIRIRMGIMLSTLMFMNQVLRKKLHPGFCSLYLY